MTAADLPVAALGLFDAAPVAAAVCTAHGAIVHANPAWLELFGLHATEVMPTLGELPSINAPELLVADTSPDGVQKVLPTGAGRGLRVTVHVRRVEPGELRLVQIVDRTALIDKIETLGRLANDDVLTGLLNRRGFLAEANRLSAIARRTRRSLALLFADIDGLKQINDDHGHHIGDAIIVEAAELLQQVFRTADALGRYGGDEFCVLALTNGPRSADRLERRLLAALAEHRTAQPSVELQMTVGVVSIASTDTETVSDAIVRADRLMYAKRARPPDKQQPLI
ncbi:MAG TPA: diguanylate cyclase [Ilumatobacteraceae bacterium]|nr:diguanylate cyclase [Ilumatobacteraceae bacterium]